MTATAHTIAPATEDDAALAAEARWQPADGAWTLVLGGDWRGAAAVCPAPPAGLQGPAAVAFDGTQLQGWDAALAARLWELQGQLHERGAEVQTQALPEGLREVLQLARPLPPSSPDGAAPGKSPRPRAPAEAAITVAFFGEVLLALARLLRGRSSLRTADVLQQLDQTGPRSLPIVLLTCALLGLMLAYMGGAQLGRIGAQGFLADVVTVGMVRELAGLMTGIILAGRVGAAFAAQLATMKAGEEIDALRVLGVDPITHLVLPRLLALLLMAPALIAFGALAGVLAGWPAAVWVYGVSSAEYLHQCLRALTFTHLWIGLFKGLLYVALVALAGCREGLHAGRDAQAVGAATTAAVVKALVWIVAAACLSTVVFTSLGY
ncbi:MAG: ABC transporter permease [Rubrivivax sp.]|nr:ABC transporter permease [Rubrivivax sp.]